MAGIAVLPAAVGWRSPVAAPLRRRARDMSTGLADDGRELAEQSRVRAQEVVTDLLRRLAEQLEQSGLADQVVDRLLNSGALDRVIAVVINHPATEAMIANVLDEPGVERLVTRVIDSRMVIELTARLLESEEMDLILGHVMRSPELRAALAHQGAGLAGDVAVGVRSRTAVADAAAERLARAVLRRPRPPESP